MAAWREARRFSDDYVLLPVVFASVLFFGGIARAFDSRPLRTGLAALAVRQPLHVWGTLLLLGLILVTTIPFRLRQMRRHYADLELRRMTAADAI